MDDRIKSVKVSMVVEGGEGMNASLEFTNTKLIVALLQQKAMLEAQLNLVNKQIAGEI